VAFFGVAKGWRRSLFRFAPFRRRDEQLRLGRTVVAKQSYRSLSDSGTADDPHGG
jgi:hypothetical protein